jgi:hypothetical protein
MQKKNRFGEPRFSLMGAMEPAEKGIKNGPKTKVQEPQNVQISKPE